MPRTVKVAVIGSGLAGLTAAYLLTRPSAHQDVQFEVHLFEKTSSLGMDSSSISLPIPGKEQTWRVDVPMRSFQGGYYKQLMALYRKLGVSFVERDFSYSFSRLSLASAGRSIAAETIYNGSSGLKGVSMTSHMRDYYRKNETGLASRAAIRAWTAGLFVIWALQLFLCYLWLIWLSLPLIRSHGMETMTFRTWISRRQPTNFLTRWSGLDRAWADFTSSILIPLFCAVCTAPEDQILEHPVEEILDYIWFTLGTYHYVVKDGVRDVVSRLVRSIKHVHLSSLISSIQVDPENLDVVSVRCGAHNYTGFHHVIFATQANRCGPLLSSYAESLPVQLHLRRQTVLEQIKCLQNFSYTPTIVINHTDETLLPDNARDHRELNFIYTSDIPKGKSPRCVPPSYIMATHILPRPAEFPPHLPVVFQTTNPTVPPKEGRILSAVSLERAVLTVASKEALKGLYRADRSWWGTTTDRLGPLQGAGGIWLCGSYAYSGIPLLEGCVVSARLVIEGIMQREGVAVNTAPW